MPSKLLTREGEFFRFTGQVITPEGVIPFQLKTSMGRPPLVAIQGQDIPIYDVTSEHFHVYGKPSRGILGHIKISFTTGKDKFSRENFVIMVSLKRNGRLIWKLIDSYKNNVFPPQHHTDRFHSNFFEFLLKHSTSREAADSQVDFLINSILELAHRLDQIIRELPDEHSSSADNSKGGRRKTYKRKRKSSKRKTKKRKKKRKTRRKRKTSRKRKTRRKRH